MDDALKKITYKSGDIVRIPLSDGTFCLGRMYEDSTIGVHFWTRSRDGEVVEIGSRPPNLVAGVFTTDFKAAKWVICGNESFKTEKESWAPPVFIRDIIDDSVSIYWRGRIKKSKESDIVGMDEQLMYKPRQLAEEVLRRICPGKRVTKSGKT